MQSLQVGFFGSSELPKKLTCTAFKHMNDVIITKLSTQNVYSYN